MQQASRLTRKKLRDEVGIQMYLRPTSSMVFLTKAVYVNTHSSSLYLEAQVTCNKQVWGATFFV